jgi:hypothetical protein
MAAVSVFNANEATLEGFCTGIVSDEKWLTWKESYFSRGPNITSCFEACKHSPSGTRYSVSFMPKIFFDSKKKAGFPFEIRLLENIPYLDY